MIPIGHVQGEEKAVSRACTGPSILLIGAVQVETLERRRMTGPVECSFWSGGGVLGVRHAQCAWKILERACLTISWESRLKMFWSAFPEEQ